MEKQILISETSKETRIAILENKDLVEFFVEKPERTRMLGNIYKGKVENVVDAIQASFIDIGYHLNAFLPFSEMDDSATVTSIIGSVDRDEDETGTTRPRRRKPQKERRMRLKTGQEILVQVIKESFAQKGPRVTTDISIPGRFLVLVPNADYIGISKKIYKRAEKNRLRKIAQELKPDKFGLIIRTVAEGQTKKVLKNDLENLMEKWAELEASVKIDPAPVCVYRDMEITSTIIRDLLTSDVDKIIVDTKVLYKRLHAYIKSVSPQFIRKIEYHHSRNPMFDEYNIEKEFNKSLNKKVWIKCGGFIVIEHTEAMTTIDVNSGKFIGKKDHEKNSLKINLQAAKEIARQLRLRDIGGLIVIDFIDMEEGENRKKVFLDIKRELQGDRARVALSPISDFGLLEMTRQRTRLNLLYSVSEECPLCHGSGRISSKESVVTKIESWFRRFKVKSRSKRLTLHLHPDMVEYIRESTNNLMRRIQWKNFLRIKIVEDNLIPIDDFKVHLSKTGDDITDQY
ncbi:MAG: Rne/Rng family ribonuclease [Candidatus Marinimicrobia bacterium]|nr:Rne/Rng family ribonuclease [Candidatus Neomarinimicrobiota bacterium]